MPGLAGIVNKSLQASHSLCLDSMIKVISKDWYQIDKYVDEHAGIAIGRADLGIVNTNDQPFKSADGSISVFLYGDIYFNQSAYKSPNNTLDLLPSICMAYQETGTEFVNELSGEFLIIIFDKRKQRMLIYNDRYGRRPLYYSNYRNGLSFSSEIKSILTLPGFSPLVDQETLAEFLTFGYILGNETMLSNVSLLPPASVLEYALDSSTWNISSYWELRLHLEPIDIADSLILDQLTDLFKTAVDRRLSKTHLVGISLSGGMDSRAIAAVADPNAYPIKSVTSGLVGCIDEKVTANIASIAGFDHVFYEFDEQLHKLSRSSNTQLIRESIIRTDGMRGTSSSAMTAFSARKWTEHGLDTVITGHGGEIAKLDHAYNFSVHHISDINKISQSFQEWTFKRMSQSSAPRFDKTNLYVGLLNKCIDEAPKSKLAEVLGRLDNRLPVEQKISFLFLNELFRKRALYALSIHKSYAEIRLPFYDDDFLKTIVCTPYRIRSNYRVHNHIITSYKPELLNIILSETRMKANPGALEKMFIGFPFKLMKKLGFYKKDFPEVYFQANSDPEFFKSILMDSKTLDRGYLNPVKLAEIIEACAQGRKDVYHLLHLLVISEIWHREYVDN